MHLPIPRLQGIVPDSSATSHPLNDNVSIATLFTSLSIFAHIHNSVPCRIQYIFFWPPTTVGASPSLLFVNVLECSLPTPRNILQAHSCICSMLSSCLQHHYTSAPYINTDPTKASQRFCPSPPPHSLCISITRLSVHLF